MISLLFLNRKSIEKIVHFVLFFSYINLAKALFVSFICNMQCVSLFCASVFLWSDFMRFHAISFRSIPFHLNLDLVEGKRNITMHAWILGYLHTCILAYSLLPSITKCDFHFCSRAGFIDCCYFFHIIFLPLSYSFETIRINSIAFCYLLYSSCMQLL